MAPTLDATFAAQLPHTLARTDFPRLGTLYEGKVRDTYRSGERLILITTDRVSAFDRVLTTLPFKGDLLNLLSNRWFEKTSHLVANHILSTPDPAVTVARATVPYPIEFVVRGYLSGSLWREYQAGRDPFDLRLPRGMRQDQRFDKPILTPATKAPRGEHDLPLTRGEAIASKRISARDFDRAQEASLAVFSFGQEVAATRGLILVDTKYEFGAIGSEMLLIDEVHTPDSSRYWVADEYQARFEAGQAQRMLDKENLRQWLLREHKVDGHASIPTIPDKFRVELAITYAEAYARILGEAFAPEVGPVRGRIVENLRKSGLDV